VLVMLLELVLQQEYFALSEIHVGDVKDDLSDLAFDGLV
jgi:hypothetical protein